MNDEEKYEYKILDDDFEGNYEEENLVFLDDETNRGLCKKLLVSSNNKI